MKGARAGDVTIATEKGAMEALREYRPEHLSSAVASTCRPPSPAQKRYAQDPTLMYTAKDVAFDSPDRGRPGCSAIGAALVRPTVPSAIVFVFYLFVQPQLSWI